MPNWKKDFLHLILRQRRMGANFKRFTFVHVRQYIRHSETWALYPSLTVLHLLPNEDESTILVCLGDHSWSFQSISIHSNCVLLMCVGSAGDYESFEHVQTFRVASANKFHSCLCTLKTCSYCVCRTAYVLYSSHSHYILTVFWLF